MLADGQAWEQRAALGYEREATPGQGVRGHAADVLARQFRIAPEIGLFSPAIVSSVVVLPAPFGPSSATTSPGRTLSLTSRTTAICW